MRQLELRLICAAARLVAAHLVNSMLKSLTWGLRGNHTFDLKLGRRLLK
ncbi:MAG TPA: hypothetical protein VFY67_14070 [Pyrinomonadaceae bacterium]|nr:hypothetical protein [Pyrinomonadaceae bacterium]